MEPQLQNIIKQRNTTSLLLLLLLNQLEKHWRHFTATKNINDSVIQRVKEVNINETKLLKTKHAKNYKKTYNLLLRTAV